MNLDLFVRERTPAWNELEAALTTARRKPERLGPQGVLRLGSLYRQAAADLAYARRRWPGDPVVARLESLVGRARHLVYDAESRRRSLLSFFGTDYWRLVVARRVAVGMAWALLLVPAALSATWALTDPDAAQGLVPVEYHQVTEKRDDDLGLSSGEQAAFSSAIFTNNIRVSFLAFGGGIAAGLGTVYVLGLNGLMLGTIGGLAFEAGNGGFFTSLVIAHGVLELSCIAVTAGAGLAMGWALVDPGRKRRSQALRDEARAAVQIVLGTMPWFVLAGIIEGFITPRGLGLATVAIVGLVVASLYWALTVWRGRTPAGTELERRAAAGP